MADVITFRPKQPVPENLHTIPDVPANHERDGQGPPIGSQAWSCIKCGSFAFCATVSDWRCYECHNPRVF